MNRITERILFHSACLKASLSKHPAFLRLLNRFGLATEQVSKRTAEQRQRAMRTFKTLQARAAVWGQELNAFDWAEVQDLDTVGTWPTSVKVTLLCFAFVLCMLLGHFWHLQEPRREARDTATATRNLKQQLQHKTAMAAGLDASRIEAREVAGKFNSLLQYLPSAAEVPGLIDDITAAGESSGLEITLIQPSGATAQEFYTDLPIQINAVGGYHDFAAFVSSVAAIERIVTLQDFLLKQRDDGRLDISVTAHTYRYRPPRAEDDIALKEQEGVGRTQGTQDAHSSQNSQAKQDTQTEAHSARLPFTYDAAARPSPFAEPTPAPQGERRHPTGHVAPDFSRRRSHLESEPLNDLILVGWLRRGGEYEALVKDRAGSVHRLRAGDYLGRNHGRVTAITAGRVSVVEIVPAGSGWMERPQTLSTQGRSDP